MNAKGDGDNINIIKMRHRGADVNFNRMGSTLSPVRVDIPVERDKYLLLEFQDLYEVESLIYALQEFKEACQLHMGSWNRGRT